MFNKIIPKSSSYYLVNLLKVKQKVNLWRNNLPNVNPYYAVKCNPNEHVIKLLNSMDVKFDCASMNELVQLKNYNINPDNIIFANPCKMNEHIHYANINNINLMTFDSYHELIKIKMYHPFAKLIIRIRVDDSKAKCKFSKKFGIDIEDCSKLLDSAKELGLNVVGISFHVGSNCSDENSYYNALLDSIRVCDIMISKGYKPSIIDIGGGFPGDNDIKFIKMAEVIRKTMKIFTNMNINFIAEPGRYFATSAFILVTTIINKKVFYDSKGRINKIYYYLSDGVYGSYNNIKSDYAKVNIKTVSLCTKYYPCVLYGPTCDAYDCITESILLPDLNVGENLYSDNMGAYTLASTSVFNGFDIPECHYYDS
jgi:ornithine decarboxylase